MVFAISAAVAAGLGLILVGAYMYMQVDTTVADRLHAVSDATLAAPSPTTKRKTEASFVQRFVLDIGNWYQVKVSKDEKSVSATKQRLSMAGWRSPGAVAMYTGSTLVAASVGAGLFAFACVAGGIPEKAVSLASVGVIMGVLAPRLFVNHKVKSRQIGIMKTVPDVIDMLILCVESGLGLNTAIKRTADERCRSGHDVMGLELRQMTYELQAGRTREEAFRDLAERNGVEELKSLAAFMIQSEKLGTNVAYALRIYAEEARIARRQRAQEMANKAAVKLLFPLVFFIFPTMFIVILGPALMTVKANLPH